MGNKFKTKTQMKFLALAAVATALSLDRSLGGKANGEDAAWTAYQNAKKAVDAAEVAYTKALAHARHEEGELQREIDETIAQEAVVKAANEAALKAGRAVFAATLAQHKAFEAYGNAMLSDKLAYTK